MGVASIVAGVLYTGGPRPYGYEGLGELFVFLFFGVVAVTGSYYVQTEDLTWEAFALSVPVGLLAAAILVVNNVRDADTDRRAGQAHAGGEAGARACAGAVRGDAGGGLRRAPRAWPPRAGCPGGWRSPRWPGRSPRRSFARCERAPTAPPSTARSPPPAAFSACSRCSSPPGSCSREAHAAAPLDPAAAPVRHVERAWCPLARWCCCGSRTATARAATGRRRRSSPTTACPSSAPWRRSRAEPGCGRPRPGRPRRSPGWTSPARQELRPLAELRRDSLPVNMTLPAGPPDEVAARAREGLAEGYACFKVKVGLPDDAERVAAVREAVGSLAGVAGGRQRRVVGGRGRAGDHGRSRSTTSSSSSSPAARSRSWRRCASGCPRRSPPTRA